MQTCKFDRAWIGSCGKETAEGDRCEEHKNLKCSVCGREATRECSTASSLVCGAPLCDHCRHGCMGNKEFKFKGNLENHYE